MIVKLVFVPSFFVIIGLVLLGIAMLSPVRDESKQVSRRTAPFERIRELERLARGPAAVHALRGALTDPDPRVSAVAAILLRDCET
ncbi:MAG TPA: hypothetical protein VGG22_09035 [Candidatus Baltobacteraceae bacterium]|jgi:hypothetical protein